jgi:hypothetical protein
MNVNILDPKVGVIQMSSQEHNGDFLHNGVDEFLHYKDEARYYEMDILKTSLLQWQDENHIL